MTFTGFGFLGRCALDYGDSAPNPQQIPRLACLSATSARTLAAVSRPIVKWSIVLWVLVSLLATTSHYLAHYHFPGETRTLPAAALGYDEPDLGHEDSAGERCGLCLQLDRLPAPPVALTVPAPSLVLIATAESLPDAQAYAQVAAWQPPSRGPPGQHTFS